jgi:hypothetical protein
MVILESNLTSIFDSMYSIGRNFFLSILFFNIESSLNCALSYEWQDGNTNPNDVLSQSGIYSCNVVIQGDNLVQNGDFESGNTLFTTSYLPGSIGPWGEFVKRRHLCHHHRSQ